MPYRETTCIDYQEHPSLGVLDEILINAPQGYEYA